MAIGSLFQAVFLAMVMSTSFVILMAKTRRMKKLIRYDLWFDIGFTLGVPMLMGATLGGFVLGILSGFFLSIQLGAIKWYLGRSEKLQELRAMSKENVFGTITCRIEHVEQGE